MNEKLEIEPLALALYARYGRTDKKWSDLSETQRDRWRQDAVDVREFYAGRTSFADVAEW